MIGDPAPLKLKKKKIKKEDWVASSLLLLWKFMREHWAEVGSDTGEHHDSITFSEHKIMESWKDLIQKLHFTHITYYNE